jgi:hypothetical protein
VARTLQHHDGVWISGAILILALVLAIVMFTRLAW